MSKNTGSAFDRQVGGNYYKDYAYEPYEFFFVNNVPHHKAALIRRILRFDHPTGHGVKDLDKALHEVDLIVEMIEKGGDDSSHFPSEMDKFIQSNNIVGKKKMILSMISLSGIRITQLNYYQLIKNLIQELKYNFLYPQQ